MDGDNEDEEVMQELFRCLKRTTEAASTSNTGLYSLSCFHYPMSFSRRPVRARGGQNGGGYRGAGPGAAPHRGLKVVHGLRGSSLIITTTVCEPIFSLEALCILYIHDRGGAPPLGEVLSFFPLYHPSPN